jgi:hypothetical protein
MSLSVRSETLREVVGERSRFPGDLRELLCRAVEAIGAEELPELLSRHEADPANFDGKVEANLRAIAPLLAIKANCQVSGQAKFNNDLVIGADDAMVCLEIEKGSLSRFEFDILKMQAFASSRGPAEANKPVFGAFLVPDDNLVARHISGNSRESSYRYLARLCRLVAQIRPLHLEDILIVGYAMSAPQDVGEHRATRGKGTQPEHTRPPSDVLVCEAGLLPEEVIEDRFRGYPTGLVLHLRRRLAEACPKLREKLNPNSRYLGYGLAGGSDDVYIYVRKKDVIIDARLPAERADELRGQGLTVRPRDNYQAKTGWLTGLSVPHDTDHREMIVALLLEALQRE